MEEAGAMANEDAVAARSAKKFLIHGQSGSDVDTSVVACVCDDEPVSCESQCDKLTQQQNIMSLSCTFDFFNLYK